MLLTQLIDHCMIPVFLHYNYLLSHTITLINDKFKIWFNYSLGTRHFICMLLHDGAAPRSSRDFRIKISAN